MIEAPYIAVVDEGSELDDVRSLLDELGLEYDSWEKDSVTNGLVPRRLLVVTATIAVTSRYRREPASGGEQRPVWIAVSPNDSRSQRNVLLHQGFDYMVQRPVHPTALRLLLQRALYRGDDQRRGRRVAVGYGVTLRTGLVPRRATLVDLSATGARLLARKGLERGTEVSVRIPGAIDRGDTFTLLARVVRTRRGDAEGGQTGEYSIALRFQRMDGALRDRLRRLLATLASGPASLPNSPELRSAAVEEPDAPVRQRRSVFEREIMIFGNSGCALVARDLSRGGLRVEQHPALSVGEQVRLAIPAAPPEEPVVVTARVARDDGDSGLALVFESVESGDKARLERIISRHPAIESLAPEEAGGIVVANLLPSLQRIAEQSKGWSGRFRWGR